MLLKKALPGILMLLSFLIPNQSWAQEPIPFTINNTSDYADSELYVAIVGEDLSSTPGIHVWVDCMTGTQYPMNRSYNTVPGPVYGGNTNPDGTAKYADCFTKLSDIPNKTISLAPIQGCRVFISVSEQLYLFFHGASGAPSGYTSPSLTDPTDPNQGIRYELIELTYNQYGFFGNPTRVDSYQAPIGMELLGYDGYYKKVGEMASHEEIIATFPSSVPVEFQNCLNIETGEIVAPSKAEEFADGSIGTMPTPGLYVNYMKPYIDQIWTKYTNEDLIFDSGDAGIWKGRVQGEQFVFEAVEGGFLGRKGVIVRRPTTQEAFEGKGVLDNVVQDATTDLLVQAQITAAINRHVIDVSSNVTGQQDWSDASTYYLESPCNHYAKFFHQQGISVNNLSYGFAYDDVWDHSPSVHTPQPEKVIVNFGYYTNVQAPVLTSIVVTPNSADLKLDETQQFTAKGYDQNGVLMNITPTWTTTGGSVSDSGLYTAGEEGDFTVTASVETIKGEANVKVTKDNVQVCTGSPANGDYTYQVSGDNSDPTITFVPGRSGVGDNIVILYYGTSENGGFPGYVVQPNAAYQINAAQGQTIWFYYTYSVPEGGERNTMNEKHNITVGNCGSVTQVLTSIDITPANSFIVVNQTQQFTATGYDRYGQTMSINPTWNVSGGGSISQSGLFFASVEGSGFTVTATDGSVSGTTSYTVTGESQACIGSPASGDYTYEASANNTDPTLTFVPGRSGVGNNIVILYYGTAVTGNYPGYIVNVNQPFTIDAPAGQTIYFYYTYSVPEGGERNTMNERHSFVVGNCGQKAATMTSAENRLENAIRIYPNPANERLTICMDSFTRVISTTIYDLSGRKCLSQNLTKAKTELDVSTLRKGIYMITIHNGVKNIQQKLVIQ